MYNQADVLHGCKLATILSFGVSELRLIPLIKCTLSSFVYLVFAVFIISEHSTLQVD